MINTTGKTEFVKTKDGYSPVFDGWVYGGGKNNSTVKITNYGIELKAVDTGGIQIQQNFDEEFIKKISGNYLTISNESIDAKTRIVLKRNGIYTNIVVVEPGYTEATSLTKYTYIPGDLMFFAITDINGNLAKVKWVKLELGERATPLEYVSKAQTLNEIRTMNPEVLLWKGTMTTGQSAVVDGLKNFDKFKVHVNNAGFIYLSKDGYSEWYTGIKHNVDSNLNPYISIQTVLINKQTNRFSNSFGRNSLVKNLTTDSFNNSSITEIWGIY